MSDKNDDKPQDKQPTKPVSVPLQKSPQDTSNWDERAFTTPTDRIVIETNQGNDNDIVVSE
jgi:hypothetical protein